jgi:hypothetical protein
VIPSPQLSYTFDIITFNLRHFWRGFVSEDIDANIALFSAMLDTCGGVWKSFQAGSWYGPVAGIAFFSFNFH